MDLDRFFPLIFFLIIFASILRKKFAKRKKASDASDRPAEKPAAGQWLGKLAEVLNQVKSEIEAAREKAAAEERAAGAQTSPREANETGLVWDKNALPEDTPRTPTQKVKPSSFSLEGWILKVLLD